MTTTFALPVPSSSGSLEQYIQAVNSVPMLTPEQETELATRFQQEMIWMPLARWFCRTCVSSYPFRVVMPVTACHKPT
jgi:hypothetical protein